MMTKLPVVSFLIALVTVLFLAGLAGTLPPEALETGTGTLSRTGARVAGGLAAGIDAAQGAGTGAVTKLNRAARSVVTCWKGKRLGADRAPWSAGNSWSGSVFRLWRWGLWTTISSGLPQLLS